MDFVNTYSETSTSQVSVSTSHSKRYPFASDSVISKIKHSDLRGIIKELLELKYLVLSLSRIVHLVEHQRAKLEVEKSNFRRAFSNFQRAFSSFDMHFQIFGVPFQILGVPFQIFGVPF